MTELDELTKRLVSTPPLPLLLKMAAPNSAAFMIQAGVSLAEVWFVSQLGSRSLTAIALVFPLLMLKQGMAAGAMGGAVASAIARALGAGETQRAERLIWHALCLAVAGALIFLLAFLLAGQPFLEFLGGRGTVLEQALVYCWIFIPGGIFVWLVGIFMAIFRGMGNMLFPALMMVVSASIQVPFSGALVLGLFGLPQLGLAGAAISLVAANFLISTIMILRLMRNARPIRLSFRMFTLQKECFQDIFKVFLPASLSPFLTVGTIVCLTAIVGRFGEQALAGYGIGSRIEFLMIPLVLGLGASMTSLVGMSIGAKRIARAESVGWTGGCAAFLLSGGIGLSLAATSEIWISLFTTDAEVASAAGQYIQILGPCYAFYGLGLALYFASQGAGAMRWPTAAMIVRAVLAVCGALLLAFEFEMGLVGIYTAAAVGMILFGLIMAGALKLGAWRNLES